MKRNGHGRALLMGVVALSMLARIAHADVDANGPWYLELSVDPIGFTFECESTFTQAGTTLSASTPFCFLMPESMTGTIAPATGAFTLVGTGAAICTGANTLAATVAADGKTFGGTLSCGDPTFPGDISVTGSRCGNGVLDTGEECDDGNRYDGDCCSRDCTPRPAGTECGFGDPCLASTCDGAGTCTFIPAEGPCDDFNDCTAGDACVAGTCIGANAPDGTSCDDFDLCSTGDRCESGWCAGAEPLECGACQECDSFEGCVEEPTFFCGSLSLGRSQLRLRDQTDDRGDALSWQLVPDDGVSIGELGNPRSTTSYEVCVYEDFGFGRLLAGLEVPAGTGCNGDGCWKPRRSGFLYTDKSGRQDGVRSMKLSTGKPGKGKLAVKAKGAGIGLASLPAAPPVLVQVQSSDGACWESYYDDPKRNDPLGFDARSNGSPSGSFVTD